MDVVVARNFAVDAEITQNDGEGVTKLIVSFQSIHKCTLNTVAIRLMYCVIINCL